MNTSVNQTGNMALLVCDTSVIIDHLRTGRGLLEEILYSQPPKDIEVILPSIIVLELWAGQSMNNEKELEKVEALIAPMEIVSLDKELSQEAGKLKRNHSISGFDAIIAATALHFDAQLVTLNIKHFQAIPELKLFKP